MTKSFNPIFTITNRITAGLTTQLAEVRERGEQAIRNRGERKA